MKQSSQLVKRTTGSVLETAPLAVTRRRVRVRRNRGGRLAHGSYAFSVIALTMVALIGLAASALTYRAGRAWRDRAASEITRTDDLAVQLSKAQAAVAAATNDLVAAQEQLSATTTKLERSEADVAQLEARVRELGTEKARIEDEAAAVLTQRGNLAAAARLAAQASNELNGCVNGMTGWLAQRPSALEPGSRWSEWVRTGELLLQACANATATNTRLIATLNG